MNCIKIIYKEENGKVTINEVDNYINKQGIWALFGKREDIFECLNVGKCIDVGREILYDISCLHNILLHKEGNEEYINQFAELCNFKYRKNGHKSIYTNIFQVFVMKLLRLYMYIINLTCIRKRSMLGLLMLDFGKMEVHLKQLKKIFMKRIRTWF